MSSGLEILSVWCSCMAGAYAACNHIIATLCKIEYASNEGWCTPACTPACQSNKSTEKIIEPTRLTDLFIRKRFRTDDKQNKNRERTSMEDLQNFDPRIEGDLGFDENRFKSFLEEIREVNEYAVIFKSMESLSTSADLYTSADMGGVCSIVIEENPDAGEADLTKIFIEKLSDFLQIKQ